MPYLGCLCGWTTTAYTTVHHGTPLYTTTPLSPSSCAAGSVVLRWDSVCTLSHRPAAQLVVWYYGGTVGDSLTVQLCSFGCGDVRQGWML